MSYLCASQELRDNLGQWIAYESKGHCVVIAGPGSGKTKTLTLKVARLLAEDIQEPRGVACITYNNECARELENRLDALGVRPGGRVFIGTVHSFSLTQIILPYGHAAGLGLPEDFRIATKRERAQALARAYGRTINAREAPERWELRMSNYRRAFLNRDSGDWRSTNPALAQLVEAYEEELREVGCIDFDDMPLLAVRALREHPWIQRALLAKYPALVVDEYQDLGRALHSIVTGLCFGTGMRLFAVGDADQSIYGFTGAQPELLQRLASRPDVENVHLRLNYRCGARIITMSAYALGEDRQFQPADGAEEGTTYFHPCLGDYPQHASELFQRLLPAIRARQPSLPLSEIAVLYPAAWIGNAIADAAQESGVGYIRSDGNALYPRSSRLMRWLEECAAWCCGGWRTGSPSFGRLASEGRRILHEAVHAEDDYVVFRRDLIAALWSCRDSNLSLSQWLTSLWETLLGQRLAACRTLRDEQEVLSAFVERTTTGDCQSMTLAVFAGQAGNQDCIHLSTLHSAKGRSFPS